MGRSATGGLFSVALAERRDKFARAPGNVDARQAGPDHRGSPVRKARKRGWSIGRAGQEPLFFLERHVRGDWGEVDAEDGKLNDESVRDGSRLLSAYRTLKGEKLWVITEAEGDDGRRASTCILLPEEY